MSYDGTGISIHLWEGGQIPPLRPEEEVALAKRVRKHDATAREKMIRSNLRLVVKIAADYERPGLPLLDLVSDGSEGLASAVDHFDPRCGMAFSAYAWWWITYAIQRALSARRTGRALRRMPTGIDVRAALDALSGTPWPDLPQDSGMPSRCKWVCARASTRRGGARRS